MGSPASEHPVQSNAENGVPVSDSPAQNITTKSPPEATQQMTRKEPVSCQVCGLNPPKYKCPRCLVPYCSVACNRTHRENHPPDPEPTTKTEQDAGSIPGAPKSETSTGPFRALDDSDKLRYLFKKHPCLPSQLQKIYAATQPPVETPSSKPAIPASLLRGLPKKKDAWNHDIGIRNGKEALRKAQRGGGEEGAAVREYSELILHILTNKDNQDEVDSMLRSKLAEQDSELIRRLMEQEKS